MRFLLLFVALVAAPAWSAARPDANALAALPNLSVHAPNFVASGRLGADDIAALEKAGIRTVIDLSDDEETPDFDEATAVSEAGMRYRNLPIDGGNGLTRENVERFDALVSAAGDAPTLIHCGSSNRVGALIAMRAALIEGKPAEAAIETGRSWGLKGLEPIVREQLAALSASASAPDRKAGDAQALRFPRIAMAGGVYPMPAGTLMPAANLEHRLVIDAASGETTADGILRRLDAAARAVNLYALAGVAPQRLKVAVVLHGKATAAALSDAAYRKHQGRANPDAALIGALHEAGVRLYVCGQALGHAGYTPGEVDADVRVALSAMTALTSLQADGYSLIP
jgi:uncharacterized protein (TIGR01244 family)